MSIVDYVKLLLICVMLFALTAGKRRA